MAKIRKRYSHQLIDQFSTTGSVTEEELEAVKRHIVSFFNPIAPFRIF